ncbi:MAG: hypothetical protein DMF89_24370 [Acidobacteria bacterium]|nr:MAG: hypothetical protein DMF89_24370 [Acidobacteriota bacterium]
MAACNRSDRGVNGAPASIRYPDHVAAGGNQPPAAELKSPLSGDSTDASDGSKVFSAMNCDGCHGGGALGWVGPSLVDGRWRYGGTDGALFQSIFYGRPRDLLRPSARHAGIWGRDVARRHLESDRLHPSAAGAKCRSDAEMAWQ